MDKAAEAAMLRDIRDLLRLFEGRGLLLGSDANGEFIDNRGDDGSLVTIARLTGHAAPEERDLFLHSLGYLRFTYGLVTRAIDQHRTRTQQAAQADSRAAPARKDYAAEAAMLCEKPAFKRFLMECHGLESPATTERAAQRLRSVLGITSRKQLNENDAARERWFALRRDFNTWKGRAVA